jgi:molybdate transport system substrate-binding protein
MAASKNAIHADRLLKFLASPQAAPALRESGLEP